MRWGFWHRKRREIGIRTALGAREKSLLVLIVGQALWPAGIGTLIGVAAAFGLTRLLTTYLFRIGSTDPSAFLLAMGVLLTAAIAASVVPARRGIRVDPMTVLKQD